MRTISKLVLSYNLSVKINIIFTIIYCSSIYSNAEVVNNFVVDYFVYKNVSSVIGFSCNGIVEDILLLKSLNKNNIAATVDRLKNFTKIHLLIPVALNHKLGIFLDTRCYDPEAITTVYDYATDRRLFDKIHFWLIFGDNFTKVLNDINDDAFGMSTDFVVAIPTEANNYKLYDFYNKYKKRGAPLNITFYGKWNAESGLSVSLVQPPPRHRSNFLGMPLRIIFFQPSYQPVGMSVKDWFEDHTDVTKDTRIKFGYHITNYLADMYNFSITFVESESWGPNDTVGPLVRALMSFQVDLTGTSTNMNKERAPLMKFLHQGFPFRTCFFFRNPQPRTIKVGEIFRPFSMGVWKLMCFIIALAMIVMVLNLRHDCQDRDFVQIANSYIMIIGAVCSQCTDIQMSRLSTRIVFLTMLLFSLVMYNYYSACVVSARLAEPIYKINDSLVEMGKLHLKIASERMYYLNFLLAVPSWEINIFKTNYWFKIPESERYLEPEEGIRFVNKGGFAYHAHPDVAYKHISKTFQNREICELNEVHLTQRANTMFGVTNNSTFEEIMKIGYTKISETGLHHRQVNFWQYRKPVCRRNILNASSVDMYEFATHLILLMIGVLFSLIIFICEILLSYDLLLKWESNSNWEIEYQSRKNSEATQFHMINNFVQIK